MADRFRRGLWFAIVVTIHRAFGLNIFSSELTRTTNATLQLRGVPRLGNVARLVDSLRGSGEAMRIGRERIPRSCRIRGALRIEHQSLTTLRC